MEQYKDKFCIIMETNSCSGEHLVFDKWWDTWKDAKPCAVLDNYEDSIEFLENEDNLKRYIRNCPEKWEWNRHPDSNENHVVFYTKEMLNEHYKVYNTHFIRFIIRKIDYYK